MLRSVALDGSPYSESASALAIDWATRFGARLLGLGVLDEPQIRGAEPVPHRLSRARPRLLVMGAHGHHPLRDLFATSVTRAVLRDSPVPVFIGA